MSTRSYQPCVHGRCVDGRAAYTCECQAGWGGANCSVALAGCRAAPCRHRGHCRPWLRGESDHRFNCTCAPGYAGQTCQQITTMSFSTSSYAEVNTSREEGYDISFRFKTTLGSGLLAMGRGLTYFFLELSDGRLNLHSSLLNKWEGVFIGSNLNDSNWQKIKLGGLSLTSVGTNPSYPTRVPWVVLTSDNAECRAAVNRPDLLS
ncbi:unnamed protein product [Plutella xylostella]|uniref:(diamondback moth) hypothetical protein n=1 Tax=Plutella xylostella TaxID=51655 RepID=A0A8S4FXX6_PLUXY|nr:unnamed protein product [Plutella xylostella]